MSNNRIMVIGGGPAGLEAARGIVDLGYELVLVEQRDELGGTPISASYAALTPDMEAEPTSAPLDPPPATAMAAPSVTAMAGPSQ